MSGFSCVMEVQYELRVDILTPNVSDYSMSGFIVFTSLCLHNFYEINISTSLSTLLHTTIKHSSGTRVNEYIYFQ